MKTEKQIKEELEKHIKHRKKIYNDPKKKKEKLIHDCIIETLEWVIKEQK